MRVGIPRRVEPQGRHPFAEARRREQPIDGPFRASGDRSARNRSISSIVGGSPVSMNVTRRSHVSGDASAAGATPACRHARSSSGSMSGSTAAPDRATSRQVATLAGLLAVHASAQKGSATAPPSIQRRFSRARSSSRQRRSRDRAAASVSPDRPTSAVARFRSNPSLPALSSGDRLRPWGPSRAGRRGIAFPPRQPPASDSSGSARPAAAERTAGTPPRPGSPRAKSDSSCRPGRAPSRRSAQPSNDGGFREKGQRPTGGGGGRSASEGHVHLIHRAFRPTNRTTPFALGGVDCS